MMDAVSFLIRFNVTKFVSVSDSAISGSNCAIIPDISDSKRALVGFLIKLSFPFIP